MEIYIMNNGKKPKKNKVLGKGLSALIPQTPEQQFEEEIGLNTGEVSFEKTEVSEIEPEAGISCQNMEYDDCIDSKRTKDSPVTEAVSEMTAPASFHNVQKEERPLFFNAKTGRYEDRIPDKKFKTGEVTVVSGRRANSTASLVIPNPLRDPGTVKGVRQTGSQPDKKVNPSTQYYSNLNKQETYNTAEINPNLKEFVRREIQNHTKVISNIVQSEIERLHYLEKKMQLPKDVEQINSLLEKMQAQIDKIETGMRTELQEAMTQIQTGMETFCEEVLRKVAQQNNIDDKLGGLVIQIKNEMRGEIKNRLEETTRSIHDLAKKVASRERQLLELRAEIVGINEYLKTLNSTPRGS
jgi:hypothetical protein